MKNKKLNLMICGLCFLTGIAYNSWPLAYILDNSTAHQGLASDLEKSGHPYYWLFITGDVLTGILSVIIVSTMWLKLGPQYRGRVWKLVYAGILIFGVFTAIDAILPTHCAVTAQLRCGSVNDRGLSVDALMSAIAALGVFIWLSSLSLVNFKHKRYSTFVKVITVLTLAVWTSSALSFTYMAVTSGKVHTVQQLFLSMSGIALVVVGLNIWPKVKRGAE